MKSGNKAKLFFAGDLMAGRGIDQILPHPSDPQLYEAYVRDARQYVALAERRSGPIPRSAGFDYIWGDALSALATEKPDLRLVNLETAITRSDEAWPGKGIHYRMHPDNAPCLSGLGLDCCVLANNHLLDWGYEGLTETLHVLDKLGIAHSGAGQTRAEAAAPAKMDLPNGQRMLIFSFGLPSSGVPQQWAVEDRRPGVFFLPDLSERSLRAVVSEIHRQWQPQDMIVTSIHWGANWGYQVEPAQRRFARALVDAGVDLVYGHSSHHPIGMEVYGGRLICYGCGDFLNDYEGIRGHEDFRSHLSLLYFLALEADGAINQLKIIPMQMQGLRLRHAGLDDLHWLSKTLSRESADYGLHLEPADTANGWIIGSPF